MTKNPKTLLSCLFATVFMLLAAGAPAIATEPLQLPTDVKGENVLILELEKGRVLIETLPDLAPGHVERIKTLAKQGFYDGVVFHRVIAGFMAQTGDPTGTGRGGSDLPDLKAEFSDHPFTRGVIGMARTSDPNSANSQWFIMFADAQHLNGQYTVWGRVIEGMEHIDALKKGSSAANGTVQNPDKIVSLRIAEEE